MQELLVIALFILAAGYLGWRAYKSVSRRDAGCGKGCGCEADQPSVRTVGARR